MSRKETHQDRTERVAQISHRRGDQAVFWQIAHSLAAIADALEPPEIVFNLESYGPPEDES